MSNDPYRQPGAPGGADDLQFDRAEPAPPPAGVGEPVPVPVPVDSQTPVPPPGVTACAACGEPIADGYFEANGKVVCPRCRDAVLAAQAGGSGLVRLVKATFFGVLAGIVGATIWWAVRHFTGYEVGLIAVVVGLMVGGAVKAGSQGRGGIGYQLVAVLLTYLAIAANYAPDVVRELRESEIGSNPIALAIATVIFSVAAPFLGGVSNIIGWLIIGFALYEAWVMNKPSRLSFNGPYRLANTGGAAPGVPPPLPRP